MNSEKDIEAVLSWLNDAYAMELAVQQMLCNQLGQTGHIPMIHEQLEKHVEQTRVQAQRIRDCLRARRRILSPTKSFLGLITGQMQAVSTSIYPHELLKNLQADYAAEHFEIATYTTLIAAAEKLHLTDVARVCRANLREEEAMASWLEKALPEATRQFLEPEPAMAMA